MKDYRYVIYQVRASVPFAFINWEMANKYTEWSFIPYRSVWNGYEEAADDMSLLGHLFETFNINHPDGYRGHSMSVSDVILVEDIEANEKKYYYCDSFGWEDITKEIKE